MRRNKFKSIREARSKKIMYRDVDEITKNWTASHDGAMVILHMDLKEIIIK